jgi:hypothetical protein
VIEFIILALAVWRLSSLLVHEEGPFDIFLSLRHRAGVAYTEYSNRIGKNEIARALVCLWCTSVWVGIVVVLLYVILGDLVVWLASPFALSAGAILVEQVVGGNE